MGLRNMRAGFVCLAALGFLVTAGGVRGAAPLAVFEACERLGLDWPRTLVTYAVQSAEHRARSAAPAPSPGSTPPASSPALVTLSAPATPGDLRLVDAATGTEVPFQLWRVVTERKPLLGAAPLASARISFFAELKAGGNYRYELYSGKPDRNAPRPTLKVQRSATGLTLDNGILAIRLPPLGRERTRHPRPLAEVPGPFRGIRLADGGWSGGSAFEGEALPSVTAMTCEMVEEGPLFAEARVRYEFDNGGFYSFSARVVTGDSAVLIDEQSDSVVVARDRLLGAEWGSTASVSRPDTMWGWRVVFTLAERARGAWGPDLVCANTNDERPPLDPPDKELTVAFETRGMPPKTGYTARAIPAPAGAAVRVADVDPWYLFHRNARWFSLVERAALAAHPPERTPFLAVATLHRGNWRGLFSSYTGELLLRSDDSLVLQWPLLNAPHPWTMLDSGEFDPDLPVSSRRRIWSLIAGPVQHPAALQAVRDQGNFSLDQYKEWVLEWPADRSVSYPRLAFTRAQVDAWRDRIDTHPLAEELKRFTEFGGGVERREALLNKGAFVQQVQTFARDRLRGGVDSLNTYRQAQYSGWVHTADELLADPDLPEETRREMRLGLAAVCHLFAEPNLNPRGNGGHLGNPNMPLNRTFPLVYAASLIPDHPRAEAWLRVAAEYVRYKQALLVAPGGTWGELISYYGASAPTLQRGALMLRNAGLLDDSTARRAALPARFLMHMLTPPDPRYSGQRIIPGWGHDNNELRVNVWMPAAALVHETDPEFVTAATWIWDQQGRPVCKHHDEGFSPRSVLYADRLKDARRPGYYPPQLTSVWLPGFGAILRAHAGDPLETYLGYRHGYQVSHTDHNQGDFVLYARGAPLVTISTTGSLGLGHGKGAELMADFGWYNGFRFGSRQRPADWPGGGYVSQVHADHFSDSADYLRALYDAGPQRWTRQILLLKGRTPADSTCFVFRESVHSRNGDAGELQPKWWSLRTLGAAERVTPNPHGFAYAGPYGAGLDVRVLQPAAVAVESRDTGVPKPDERITVNSVGPVAAGDDLLIVLTPLGAGEQAPVSEALAEGVARIVTRDGTDYVFADGRPMDFRHGDVAFAGIAGAVRVFPDEVHLIIAEGPATVSYKGASLSSRYPVTRRIPLAELDTCGTVAIPEPEHGIRFALDPAAGALEDVAPGVRRQATADGVAYAFDSDTSLVFEQDGVRFVGMHGGIEADRRRGRVRLVMLRGERIGFAGRDVHGGDGPYDLTYEGANVTGRVAGVDRFLFVRRPAALDRLPVLCIDGEPFAPATSRTYALSGPGNPPDLIITPIPAGNHEIELRPLAQPPVFRTWQLW